MAVCLRGGLMIWTVSTNVCKIYFTFSIAISLNIDYQVVPVRRILPNLLLLLHKALLFLSNHLAALVIHTQPLDSRFQESYLTRRQICCHSLSRLGWGPSSRDWTLLSCGVTLPFPVRPTAGWLFRETAAPRGPSPHQSRRWGSILSGGGPSQDSRERRRGAEGELAHTLRARPGWSSPLRGREWRYSGRERCKCTE